MKKKYFIWASDISNISGEGVLGRNFLKRLRFSQDYIIKIQTFENIFILKKLHFKNLNLKKKKILQQSFFHKYIGPIYGIFMCWINFLNGNKVIFLNYLPLWNFLIFILLPPGTKLGPITGSKYYSYNANFGIITRKFLLPILFNISSFILIFRYKKKIFSTDLLKDYFPKTKSIKSDFVLTLIAKKNKRPSHHKYDFVFYYRKHPTKNNLFILNILRNLSKANYRICIIGDKLKNINAEQLGYIKNDEVIKILKKSKATFSSSENLLNLFIIEAINNNVLVFCENKKHFARYKRLFDQIIPLNFRKKNNLLEIKDIFKNKKILNKKNFYIEKVKKEYENYFKNYLI